MGWLVVTFDVVKFFDTTPLNYSKAPPYLAFNITVKKRLSMFNL
jgi:hypothetical protein